MKLSLKNPKDIEIMFNITGIRRKLKGHASSCGWAVGSLPHKFFTFITFPHYKPYIYIVAMSFGHFTYCKHLHSDFSLYLNRNFHVSSPSFSHPTVALFIAGASARRCFGQCRGDLDPRKLHKLHPRPNAVPLIGSIFSPVPFLPCTPSPC